MKKLLIIPLFFLIFSGCMVKETIIQRDITGGNLAHHEIILERERNLGHEIKSEPSGPSAQAIDPGIIAGIVSGIGEWFKEKPADPNIRIRENRYSYFGDPKGLKNAHRPDFDINLGRMTVITRDPDTNMPAQSPFVPQQPVNNTWPLTLIAGIALLLYGYDKIYNKKKEGGNNGKTS